MKTGMSLEQLAREITRRASEKKDLMAPVSKLEMVVRERPVDRGNSYEESIFVPELAVTNGHIETYEPNKLAHGQIAEWAGIPAKYYQRMQDEEPRLLAGNVNTWLQKAARSGKRDRRMVRTLDGKVRAFLSDKYRPLENEDLAEVVLPILMDDLDLEVMSCDITETRLYIKAVDRSLALDVPTGHKMGDGTHTIFDTLSPVVVVSNSEVGCGALSIETGTYTKACTNLAMFGANMKKYHTGSRAEVSDEVYALLTDDTKRTTDSAVWKQVRDLVKGAFNAEKFGQVCAKLAGAAKVRMESDDVVEVVERVGRHFSLHEGERKGVLARLIEGGDLSMYGLHSAITRHSADVVDYDRATELERTGGQVIELNASQWRELTRKAA